MPQDHWPQVVDTLSLDKIQRHIFLCADQTKPKCCDKEASILAWNYLKKRLQELQLDIPTEERPASEFVSKGQSYWSILMQSGTTVPPLM